MRSHPVLDQLANEGVRLGLDRIEGFLQSMGEPHRAFPAIHVAGTNGKGSVCAMLTNVLVEAGMHVGTTVSPHLEELNERVMFDGVPVDDASLSETIEAVDRARWDWARSMGIKGSPLTYFEYMIAVAFRLFAERQVDVGVVEVGLGGRLDATNLVQPLVCAVPSIGLDHQGVLGDTIEQIAAEKAGIFKRGVPVVLGPMPVEARDVLIARARALDCPVFAPPEIRREGRPDGTWDFACPLGAVRRVRVGPEGQHQAANASVVVGILMLLRELGMPLPDDVIQRGLARPGLPGRLERLLPGLVVDGAHNPAGAEALARWLSRQPRPQSRILLVGMGADRAPGPVVAPLLPYVDEVVTTKCAHPKAREPMDLALALNEEIDAELSAGGPIEETLPEVYAEADEVIVAGSLFVAGAARSLVAAGALDGIRG